MIVGDRIFFFPDACILNRMTESGLLRQAAFCVFGQKWIESHRDDML